MATKSTGSWQWATGEEMARSTLPRRLVETLVWIVVGLIVQGESGWWEVPGAARPSGFVVAMIAIHWLWGLEVALGGALILGMLADALGGLPLGVTASSLLAACLVIHSMRTGAIGGIGGVWLGPGVGGAVAFAMWRWVVWGWSTSDWAHVGAVLGGAGFTGLTIGLLATLRMRLARGWRTPLRVEARGKYLGSG